MDASGAAIVASALGNGVALGLSAVLAITIALLPASYVMNKFSYHTSLMRVIMGIIAAVGSFGTFAIILIGCATGGFSKPHYFGLLPTFLDMGEPVAEPTGWFAWIQRLMMLIAHPFKLFYDEAGYAANIERLLVSADGPKVTIGDPLVDGGPTEIYKGAVYEPFFEKARKIGTIQNHEKWKSEIAALAESGIGQALFSPDADA